MHGSPLCTLRSLQQCGTEQGTSHVTERRSGGATERPSDEAKERESHGTMEDKDTG